MTKSKTIICEKTGKPCKFEYELVTITLAGGIKVKKIGKWKCSERSENNINIICSCSKEAYKNNA